MTVERIELLNVELLQEYAELAEGFRRKAERLGIGLGWHYLLDLVWIANALGDPAGKVVLDAGAGTGVLQWWLADRGARVISVDRQPRQDLSMRFRYRYHVRGLEPSDLQGTLTIAKRRLADPSSGFVRRLAAAGRALAAGLIIPFYPKTAGEVVLYHSDLADLRRMPDASVDFVVSVSALEHNPLDGLSAVARELWRVLKPGGALIATLAAARDQDWFHEPSQGWCYTEGALRRAFSMSESCSSNYERFDALFESLRACEALRLNLPAHYYQSGDNGMPWGVWDPKYLPVGVMKVKGHDG